MKRLIIIGTLLATTPALAQTAAPVKLPEKYTITVTADELNTIGAGLLELKKKVADPLYAKLQKQVGEQNAAANPQLKPTVGSGTKAKAPEKK